MPSTTFLASADGPETSKSRTNSSRRDRGIAKVAGNQHGVVSLAQLQAAGLSCSAIRSRVEEGRLHRVHQGVFSVGHPLLTREGLWMAAVLVCGPDAVLSHRSAAALLGLQQMGSGAIDVTAPHRRGRSPAGIAAHRDGTLHPDDRIEVSGIPCTSVARVLLDLAGTRSMREVRNAIVQAEVLRIFNFADVAEIVRRNPGRRGVARLRLLAEERDPLAELTKSELERRFLDLCKRASLPTPEVNVPLDLGDLQLTVDFLWRSRRLIVEADGRGHHGIGTAFEEDRRRDQRLTVAGWRVIRSTWRQVVHEEDQLADILRGLLA